MITKRIKEKFIQRIGWYIGLDLIYEDYRSIIERQKTSVTKAQKHLKRISASFEYLLSNVLEDLSEELIIKSYFLLTGTRMSKKDVEKLIEYYYTNFNDELFKMMANMNVLILALNRAYKREYALLLMSFISIKRGRMPVLIELPYQLSYKRALRNKNRFVLVSFLKKLDMKAQIKYETRQDDRYCTKDEVINKISKEKQQLQDLYDVKHIYLYGSKCKDTEIESSDIDIRVTFETHDDDSYERLISVKKHLSDIMQTTIDVSDTSKSIKSWMKYDFKNQIKIF